MPREVIRDISNMYDVHVGWSDNTVQLGVVTSDGKTLIDALGEMTEATGVWSSLKPETIDSLIRVLNKARYKAFPEE
jgi:hypothetical protein